MEVVNVIMSFILTVQENFIESKTKTVMSELKTDLLGLVLGLGLILVIIYC